MFVVLDRLAGKGEDARHVIQELYECEAYCNSRGDKLHSGFFFTLSQMLALKHEVQTLPGEAITFNASSSYDHDGPSDYHY